MWFNGSIAYDEPCLMLPLDYLTVKSRVPPPLFNCPPHPIKYSQQEPGTYPPTPVYTHIKMGREGGGGVATTDEAPFLLESAPPPLGITGRSHFSM